MIDFSGVPNQAIFAPGDEFFLVDGAEFVNLTGLVPRTTGKFATRGGATQAAVANCFDCCGYRSMQGVGTTRLSGLKFHNAPVRTVFACPYKSIFQDIDGSLTGDAGPGSGDAGAHVTTYYQFNEWDECPRAGTKFSNGLVCNSTVRVRKADIPLAAGVPVKFTPVTVGARPLWIKKSEPVAPTGFVAVYESTRNATGVPGALRVFEKKAIVKAVARFLNMHPQKVFEVAMPASAKNSKGMAVMIGGNADSERDLIDINRESVCNTGVITIGSIASPGLCVDEYGLLVVANATNQQGLKKDACLALCKQDPLATGCEHSATTCKTFHTKHLKKGGDHDTHGTCLHRQVTECTELPGWPTKEVAAKSTCWTLGEVPPTPFVGKLFCLCLFVFCTFVFLAFWSPPIFACDVV